MPYFTHEAQDNMEHNDPSMKRRLSTIQWILTKENLCLTFFGLSLRGSRDRVPLFLEIDMVDKMAKISTG
jgi:hypothetical protein